MPGPLQVIAVGFGPGADLQDRVLAEVDRLQGSPERRWSHRRGGRPSCGGGWRGRRRHRQGSVDLHG